MAQDVHVIDLRRSYLPVDPNAFPATMHDTEAEDRPESRIPVIPYDGYNFMPTPQGYCSFFGINSSLGIDAFLGKADDIFMIQTLTFQNILVALAEDGIWTKDGGVAGAWTHLVALAAPAAGSHKNWSKCVIENAVYVYRQGEASVYVANEANGFVFTAFVPTFLNMAGQLGIFKAGGRLGFWDSENSIAWSSLEDTTDVTPSLETLAGNTIFQDIVGKIVNVLQHGIGFIVYSTKSVVKVDRNVGSPMLWAGRAIFNNNGISYREEVCFAEPDTTHFAFTTEGLVEIGPDAVAKFTAPEISTYLKEKRDPVYLKMMNGRYLFMPILDPYYFLGRVNFTTEEVSASVYSWKRAALELQNYTSQCRSILAAMRSFDQAYLFNNFGYTAYTQAINAGEVPIWQDNLASAVPVATIEAWKAYDPIELLGSIDYFLDNPFTEGAIAKIDGSGNENFVPPGMQLASAFVANNHEEDNDKLFYHKQDFLWFAEDRFCQHWKDAIDRKVHATVSVAGTKHFADVLPTGGISNLVETKHTFGPYVDLSYFSEANRYYGIADKSAWLQRSLTRGVTIEVVEKQYDSQTEPVECVWQADVTFGAPGGPYYIATYAQAIVWANVKAMWEAYLIAIGQGAQVPLTYVSGPNEDDSEQFSGNNRSVGFQYNRADMAPGFIFNVTLTPFGVIDDLNTSAQFDVIWPFDPLRIGFPVYYYQQAQKQEFRIPTFKYVDFDTCIHKELGYTEIIGHGHYDLLGNFIEDDAIPEAPDYTDVCDSNPKKRKQPFFNGFPISPVWNNGATCGRSFETIINGVTYEYPTIPDIVIPSGTILLQAGSIEPIYPTYLGAFVYDVQYKKWGKMKQNYKQLLDYLPLNTVAGETVIPYDTFNPRVSILLEDGSIAILDQYPSDSEIIFGKIGYYRKGFTDIEEVRVNHRTAFSGVVSVEASLDGRNIEPSIGIARSYSLVNTIVEGFSLSARWYNVRIEGNYDLVHLEMRGHRTGKR